MANKVIKRFLPSVKSFQPADRELMLQALLFRDYGSL